MQEHKWSVRGIFQNLMPFLSISDQRKPVSKEWVNIYRSSPSYHLMKECKDKTFPRAFRWVCEKHNLKVIDFFTEIGLRKKAETLVQEEESGWYSGYYYPYFINDGLYGAAKGGHMDLVNGFIEQGCDAWYSGLNGAMKGKHEDLAFFFSSKIDTLFIGEPLNKIIRSGYVKILETMVNRGVEINSLLSREGLAEAIRTGNGDMINFFINRVEVNEYYFPLVAAAEMGRLDLVKLFCSRHDYRSSFKDLVRQSISYGQRHVLDFFLSQGYGNWNYILQCAMEGGHSDLVDLSVSNGATKWNKGFEAAIRGGQLEMVKLAMSKGVMDINTGLCLSIKNHQERSFLEKKNRSFINKRFKEITIKMMKFFLSLGADDLGKAMVHAIDQHSIDLINVLVEHGANDFKSFLDYAITKDREEMIIYFKEKLSSLSF